MKFSQKRKLRVEGLESRTLLAADLAALAEATVESPIVEESAATFDPGDANGDGQFDQSDLVQVFQAGKYRTEQPADWSEGDWNGDSLFDELDLIVAMQAGNYDTGSVAAKAKEVQAVLNAEDFGDPQNATPVGTAEITRTPNSVKVTLKTTELIPGNAYTNWIVVFDHPEFCDLDGQAGCNGNDFGTPEVGAAVLFGSGHVVGSDKATFSSHIRKGDDSGEIFGELTNPEGAEIHIIVRDHGPKIQGLVSEQIRTFMGGCQTAAMEPELNVCTDPQASFPF